MVVGTVVQTASQSVHMFIGARYLLGPWSSPVKSLSESDGFAYRWLIGFGLNFAATGAPMLISEIAYPSKSLTSLRMDLYRRTRAI